MSDRDLIFAPWQMAKMPKDTPVLLALSGGADSRLLLHLLAKLSARDGFSLTAAHVNHGIRGEEALRDRDFCVSICKEYDVELCALNTDIPTLARERGKGIEETARAVRYDYFERLMRERQIPLLVTAHNADDNAETVLFRMARGSGLAGLGGIRPVRSFGDGFLVRPLLRVTKKDVLAYCDRESLQYVTDSTNGDTSYARNKLRAEVLPVLESLFSGATSRIGEMATRLLEDEEILSQMAREHFEKHCADGRCPIEPLLLQPKPIRARVLGIWLEETLGVSAERTHIEAILSLAEEGRPHSAISLPCGASVAVERGALQRGTEVEAIEYQLPFCEGVTVLPCKNLSISVKIIEKNLKVHNLSTAPCIILKNDFDIMKSGLYWRARKAGDAIYMGGMHREVRKLYREAGLPLDLRANLPMLCDNEGIVWIPFVGVRDGVCTSETGWLVAVEAVDEK